MRIAALLPANPLITGGFNMNRKPVKDFEDSFVGKSPQNEMLDDYTMDFSRDDYINNSIIELIARLRRNYPNDDAIIKLSEVFGLEPKQEQNENNFCGNCVLNTDYAENDQPNSKAATSVTDIGSGKTDEETHNYVPSGFHRAVSRITLVFFNI